MYKTFTNVKNEVRSLLYTRLHTSTHPISAHPVLCPHTLQPLTLHYSTITPPRPALCKLEHSNAQFTYFRWNAELNNVYIFIYSIYSIKYDICIYELFFHINTILYLIYLCMHYALCIDYIMLCNYLIIVIILLIDARL